MRAWMWLGLMVACAGPASDKDDTDGSNPDDSEDGALDTESTDDTESIDDTEVGSDAFQVTTCPGVDPTSVARCDVSAGTGPTLFIGTVLAPEEVFIGGAVLVEDGKITCLGCDCPADGATTVTCEAGVISPGLINAHEHITFANNNPVDHGDERYEHRHNWRKGTDGHDVLTTAGSAPQEVIRWAELRNLMAGTTSIVSFGGTTGLARNLDRASNLEGLEQAAVFVSTFPLDDSSGARRTSGCDYGSILTPDRLTTPDAALFIVADGIDASARNELDCLSGAPGGEDVISAKTSVLFGTGLDASGLSLLAERGAGLVWSPRSNLSLYGNTANIRAARRLGVRVGLGTDWTATGSMNLLRELRCAAEFDDAWLDDSLSAFDLWQMATLANASLTASDDAIGKLAVGSVADLVIFDGSARTRHAAAVLADPEDVVLVVRGGKVLYGDAAVIDALRGAATCDPIDVCGVPHAVCIADEVGQTLAQLQAAVGTTYPLFACDVPEDEPTCVPSRTEVVDGSSVYTGAPSGTDADGDGVPDATDLCPSVFDPIRPMEGGVQADVDGDGLGDACDACPVEAGATGCP